jgi:NADPH:quinone reductase-like Zn-dependent oxidoreductase
MRTIELCTNFGVDSLQMQERPDPTPGPGEVIVQMHAYSINYRDLLVIDGVGRWRPSLPRIPLSDGVGRVVATGAGVARVKVGDRVMPIFYPHWLEGGPAAPKLRQALGGAAADGVLADYVRVPEASLVPVPEHLTDVEAATLPCAGVTAWHAVIALGPVRPGDTVVVLGTGGVAMFALQFARLCGARVIVTSRSEHKLERARALGATAGIHTAATPDWPGAVMELTDGVGADRVVDTVGRLQDAIAAVRIGGRIAFVGLLDGMRSDIDLVTLMGKSARIDAVDVGSRAMFEAMNTALTAHTLRPVVDRVFGWSELGAALTYLQSARHVGKVCLQMEAVA